MQLSVLALLVLIASGCGSTMAPPENVRRHVGPPRAWLETSKGHGWLARGSSCWRFKDHGVCADAGAPSCGQSFVPHFGVTPGETLRVHLGFTPDEASLSGDSGVQEPAEVHGRIVQWQASKGGVFSVFARERRGDASYSGCLDLTN